MLICDVTGETRQLQLRSRAVLAHTPLECLNLAVIHHPERIAIRFGKLPVREHETLFELCMILKQNPFTKDIGLTAVFEWKNREFMERLGETQIEYALFVPDFESLSSAFETASGLLGDSHRLDYQLGLICPHLHCSRPDISDEVTLCGAYLCRLIPGKCRLQEICRTRNHRQCEFFLNPRFAE